MLVSLGLAYMRGSVERDLFLNDISGFNSTIDLSLGTLERTFLGLNSVVRFFLCRWELPANSDAPWAAPKLTISG